MRAGSRLLVGSLAKRRIAGERTCGERTKRDRGPRHGWTPDRARAHEAQHVSVTQPSLLQRMRPAIGARLCSQSIATSVARPGL
jgi:hypothetical protein